MGSQALFSWQDSHGSCQKCDLNRGGKQCLGNSCVAWKNSDESQERALVFCCYENSKLFLAGEPGEVSPFFSEESCVVVVYCLSGWRFWNYIPGVFWKNCNHLLNAKKKKSAFVSCERWKSFGRITLVLQEWYLGCRRIWRVEGEVTMDAIFIDYLRRKWPPHQARCLCSAECDMCDSYVWSSHSNGIFLG